MRLLAHGGTLLAERARVGKWPDIHPALLEEKYGLRGGKRILGVGSAGESPFLIIRELQANVGRLYSFTLLLDPGQAVWGRFEWNAAALLEALLERAREPASIASRMFSAPEQLTLPDLESCCSALAPRFPRAKDGAGAIALAECVAGSIALGPSLAVAPSDIGLDGRPEIAEMAAALEHLPRWLRIGRGWMSGGGIEQAEALGAELVFDDESPKETAAMSVLRSKGSWAIDLFREMTKKPGLEEELERLPPAWMWEAPARDLQALAPVSVWLHNELADGELIRALPAAEKSAVRRLVMQAAELALREGSSKLDGETTRVVLLHFAAREQSVSRYLQRLDKDAIREAIRRDFSGHAPASLGLPDTVRLEVQIHELERTRQGVVSRLAQILSSEAWSPEEQRQLLQTAWTRFVNVGEPLQDWAKLRNKPVWTELTDCLRREANRRATEKSATTWLADYLTFGEADIAHEVACSLAPQELDFVISGALRELKGSAPALNLLSALASSPLRPHIDLEKKIEVAQRLVQAGNEAWRPFLVLVRLMRGESVAPMRIDDGEAGSLRQEIQGLLKCGTAAPDLESLLNWDGLLDRPVTKMISRYRFDRSRLTVSWLAGLRLAVERGWADRETYELNLIESMEHEIAAGLDSPIKLPEVSEGALSEWLHGHLFERDERNAALSIKVLAGVCKKWGTDRGFQQALLMALARGLEDEESRKAFSKRFFAVDPDDASERLDVVFMAIPQSRRHDVVDALFADEDQPIPELLAAIIDGDGRDKAFRRAVLEFVADRHAHPVKQLLAKSQFGRSQKKMKAAAASKLLSLTSEVEQ